MAELLRRDASKPDHLDDSDRIPARLCGRRGRWPNRIPACLLAPAAASESDTPATRAGTPAGTLAGAMQAPRM